MEDPQVLDQIHCYCLFCRSGQERAISARLQDRFQELTALAPVRLIPEKRQGIWQDREHVILPGYVFVYVQGTLPFSLKHKEQHIYKLLNYDDDLRELVGDDRDYALWIYRYSGRITPSRVLCQGDAITILSGPLKDCKGRIRRLDRHKRKAWIDLTFDGQIRTVCLGAEFFYGEDP